MPKGNTISTFTGIDHCPWCHVKPVRRDWHSRVQICEFCKEKYTWIRCTQGRQGTVRYHEEDN